MPSPSIAERATFVAAVIGIAIGVLFLFAPIHGYCMSSAIMTAPPAGATQAPLATFGNTVCGNEALWQRQPIFPMPFFAVLVWSLAPSAVYFGTRLRTRGEVGTGTLLMAIGLVLAFTCIISFGAVPIFLPFVAVPTLIASVIAFARSPMG